MLICISQVFEKNSIIPSHKIIVLQCTAPTLLKDTGSPGEGFYYSLGRILCSNTLLCVSPPPHPPQLKTFIL